jgi:hypothetical protein
LAKNWWTSGAKPLTSSANGKTHWLGEFRGIPTSTPRLPKFSCLWISGDPSWACMLPLLVLHQIIYILYGWSYNQQEALHYFKVNF